ncbi:2Fe-2S iron-sulfur cluster-binding protein [Thalassolituus oleivorans]|uniref:2Fe-2S iron-sulfur cluster-binding protein n=1 Tax=Thalassolituus oleivorans TaxID=187493 RepID=UPI003B82F804
MHVLEAMGAPVDSDCRNGTCGRCRITVSLGDVSGSQSGDDAVVLACCSRPASDLVISL